MYKILVSMLLALFTNASNINLSNIEELCDKGDNIACLKCGYYFATKGDYKTAITYNKKALNLNSKDNKPYSYLGFCYFKLADYDKALWYYNKALELNSNDPTTYYNKGLLFYNQNFYNKAIKMYKKTLELDPKYFNAYYNMGIIYYLQHQYAESLFSYKKSLSLNPKNASIYINIFELELITNKVFDKHIEKKYRMLFQNNKEIFIKYEMLKVLQNIVLNKDDNLKQWEYKYSNVSLKSWNFSEINNWVKVQENKLKSKLNKALEVFKKNSI